ncbi:hypothetical protein ACQ4PT_070185 [Festuca glaucescens]
MVPPSQNASAKAKSGRRARPGRARNPTSVQSSGRGLPCSTAPVVSASTHRRRPYINRSSITARLHRRRRPPPLLTTETASERMGNCQAAEEATVVVQHPGGRVERLYWATSAAEVMRANPGHYVALVTLRVSEDTHHHHRPADPQRGRRGGGTVRLTRVKLLKPRDTLQLGHAYRLIAIAEVAKAVQARKEEKTRSAQRRQQQQQQGGSKQAGGESASTGDDQALMDEGLDQLEHQDRDIHHRSNSAKNSRHRQWRPSLHSIAEVSS